MLNHTKISVNYDIMGTIAHTTNFRTSFRPIIFSICIELWRRSPISCRTRIKVHLDLCINLGHLQVPIWCTLDRKKHKKICWLVNMEYEHLKLWLLCCCFCMMFLSPQVHIPYYIWTSGLSRYTYMSIVKMWFYDVFSLTLTY
jgi:hypothetical protein